MRKKYTQWDSRKETLNMMFERFIVELDKMKINDAVWFSGPMCNILMRATHEAKQMNAESDGDRIINSISSED